ncbi:MAG: substrate-binding domain-containing protein [Chitinophagaceae bacterium]
MKVRVVSVCAVICCLICAALLNSCGTGQQTKAPADTKNNGRINVSADESFKPIIDAQVQVYQSNHPGTIINVIYKAEAECLKDFLVDSIRMVIATRRYSEQERMFMIDSLSVSPDWRIVARDAIAVIVNPLATDSLFTMKDLRDVLKGKFRKKLIPVFDGLQATSTVRFIVDSVLHGDSLGPDTRAAKTSEEVIDFVANNVDAIGLIGVSWIGNRDDPDQLSFLKKVKIAQLESNEHPGMFIFPVQANIYPSRYPMVRDLVYTLKENYKGLGHGFADFLSGEIGQLIFRRAYLMPAQRDFRIRSVILRQ